MPLQVNVTNSPEETNGGDSLIAALPTPRPKNLAVNVTNGEGESLANVYQEGKFDKETGIFTYKGASFNLKTPEGRAALIKFMANSKDAKLLDELEDYINKHHPGRDIKSILGREIINTILAGFFSGRTGTGGAGPLTTEGQPPAIDITVDDSTIKYLLKAVVSFGGDIFQFVKGFVNAFIDYLYGIGLEDPSILDVHDKGALIAKDSWIGRKIPTWMYSWFGMKDNKDGTLTVGEERSSAKFGEFSADLLSLIIGPGKAKAYTRGPIQKALSKVPKTKQQRLAQIMAKARQRADNELRGTEPSGAYVNKVYDRMRNEIQAASKNLGPKAFASRTIHSVAKRVGSLAPLAAEWIAAETIAKSMLNKYGTFLSGEDKQRWATWFAFNYVWADLTIQVIDKIMPIIWSIKGEGRGDVKTIGGFIVKILAAEILTGAQILAGIGITKIQKGEITLDEYIKAVINFDFKKAGLDAPVTINEVLQAIAGDDLSGKDFDVFTFTDGKSYTYKIGTNHFIDDQGKKITRGSKLGNDLYDYWQKNYGDKSVTEQSIDYKALGGFVQKPKSLIARAQNKASAMAAAQEAPIGTSPMNPLIGSPDNKQLTNSLIAGGM